MSIDTKKRVLVIVESPTKAKTIRRFLPKNYKVEACVGHIRDLPASAKEIPAKYKGEKWASLGINVKKNFEPIYVIPNAKRKVIKKLKEEMAKADELVLATDEDREGESISFHLIEVLKPKIPIKRMVFHEITKTAIQEALKNFREVDTHLVEAQESRRILDRLVGYTLSPLIWKKIAYGLSAGRVQSVAVRIIVERERQRLKFKRGIYCGLLALLGSDKGHLEAKLVRLNDQKIATGKDFDESTGQIAEGKKVHLLLKEEADKLKKALESGTWKVKEVVEKPVTRKPAPPFITSTLQQEANRKLGLSARDAMRVAQRLYENGLITYMRTDSTNLSKEAIAASRAQIKNMYGKEYLSPQPKVYASKSKGAQEAHEAIRPAGQDFAPPEKTGLSGAELKLYELIWKRTMACQMADAKQLRVAMTIEAGNSEFQSNGMRILFPGFLRAYVEGSDDADAALEDREIVLPDLKVGDVLRSKELNVTEHETKPPARFTEAALVQTLEKEGVGRPSTYASIISTIQDRGYVRRVNNALVPTFTAFAVNKLLTTHFPEFVDLQFTSGLEDSLDSIAVGEKSSKDFLKNFYLDEKQGLLPHLEREEGKIDPDEARAIKIEKFPHVEFRVGRFGPYFVVKKDAKSDEEEEARASIPENYAPGDLTEEDISTLIDLRKKGPPTLGKDPETGKKVYVMVGRYGPYLQLGMPEVIEPTEEEIAAEKVKEERAKKRKKKKTSKKKKTVAKPKKPKMTKPKRAAIPKGIEPSAIKFDEALGYLRLPRELGDDGEGHMVKAGLGRFGPFVVKTGGGLEKPEYRSLKKEDHVLTVGLKRALEIFAEPRTGRGRRKAEPLRVIGEHPHEKKPLEVRDGPYGMYIKCGKINASIPKEKKHEDLTLEEAVELIEERREASR